MVRFPYKYKHINLYIVVAGSGDETKSIGEFGLGMEYGAEVTILLSSGWGSPDNGSNLTKH